MRTFCHFYYTLYDDFLCRRTVACGCVFSVSSIIKRYLRKNAATALRMMYVTYDMKYEQAVTHV